MNARPPDATRSVTLDEGDLSALKPLLPEPSQLSPLAPLTSADAGRQHADRLAALGVVDGNGRPADFWAPALDALARPLRHVVTGIGRRDGLTTLHAYQGGSTGGSYVAHGLRGSSSHMIAFPLEPADVIVPLFSNLGLEAATPELGVGVDLTLDGAVALAGMVDAVRAAEAEALIARDTGFAGEVGPAEIGLGLSAGWMSQDYRWLAPILRQMIPVEAPIGADAIARGLDELAELGLAARSGDGSSWAFTADFDLPRRTLGAPVSFGVVAVVEARADANAHAYLGALRALGALWAFEFLAGEPDLLRVCTTTEERFLGALRGLIEEPAEAVPEPAARDMEEPAPAAAATRPRFCTQCGARLGENDRFCTSCGAAIGA